MRTFIGCAALMVSIIVLSGCGPEPIPLPQVDEFDGKSTVEWTVLEPDEGKVSSEKNEGCLTITPQPGRVFGDYEDTESGPPKNMYLIELPGVDQDIDVALDVTSFQPTLASESCSIVFYNSADDFVQGSYRLSETGKQFRTFGISCEKDGKTRWGGKRNSQFPPEGPVTLRMTKRGNEYAFSFNYEGEHSFTAGNKMKWGDGKPKYVGFYVSSAHHVSDEVNDVVIESFALR